MPENKLENPGQEAEDLKIVQYINQCRVESEGARNERMALTRRNKDATRGRQDWGYKEEGQSREFIPKTVTSLESFSATIKKGMTAFGNWFSVEMPEGSIIDGSQIRDILMSYFKDMPASGVNNTNISHIMSDAAKTGLIESLIIIKIHGERTEKNSPFGKSIKPWRLKLELVPSESYYPDPRGHGLYEIHRVERDLSYLVAMAEQGIYDKEVVEQIKQTFVLNDLDFQERMREKNLDESETPPFRKLVVIDEYWGNILGDDGRVTHKNIVAAVANDTYLIRRPVKNRFWHGESPFVVGPLLRVPFTVWHRALYDQAVPINEAMNEIFNLMLDGGLASVWGIKQIRPDWLEDPRQASGGLPQGMTLVVNDSAPPDAKVLQQVSTGEIPPEAMAMYNLLDKEFNSAALTNDIKLGALPSKQVKATEVLEASQNSAATLDAIISDFEEYITQIIRKSWITILQNTDHLNVADIDSSAGRRVALTLSRLTPKERFDSMGSLGALKVFGISASIARARDFQKLMALLQIIQQNPLLLNAFHKKYSEDKIISHAMNLINLKTDLIERSPEELKRAEQETRQAQVLNSSGVSQPQAQATGEAGTPSEINQIANPSDGL